MDRHIIETRSKSSYLYCTVVLAAPWIRSCFWFECCVALMTASCAICETSTNAFVLGVCTLRCIPVASAGAGIGDNELPIKIHLAWQLFQGLLLCHRYVECRSKWRAQSRGSSQELTPAPRRFQLVHAHSVPADALLSVLTALALYSLQYCGVHKCTRYAPTGAP